MRDALTVDEGLVDDMIAKLCCRGGVLRGSVLTIVNALSQCQRLCTKNVQCGK